MKQHTAKKVLAGLLGAVLLSTSIPFATVTAVDAEAGAVIYSSDFEDSSASLPFTGRGGVESISITSSQAQRFFFHDDIRPYQGLAWPAAFAG